MDENFSTNNGGVYLSVESRAIPADGEEVQLEVNTYRDTNYIIVAEADIIIPCVTAFLFDNYTGITTEIPQSGTVNYSYSIAPGIAASIANDRFKIIFSNDITQITWNGSISSSWEDSNNWTPNEIPNQCAEVSVPTTNIQPEIAGEKTIKSLSIGEGSNVVIPAGSRLNIVGDLIMYSTSDSYSGLLVYGAITVTGTTKYHRYTNSQVNDNDLIAPPLSGQSWTSFLTDDDNYNANLLFNNGETIPNTAYLFGPFEKGITDNFLVYNYNTTANLNTGLGYSVATNTPIGQGNGEPLIFTGSIVTGPVNIPIWNDITGDFPEWNLIGNPYASYIDVDTFLNHIGSV